MAKVDFSGNRSKREKELLDYLSTDLPAQELGSLDAARGAAGRVRGRVLDVDLPGIAERVGGRFNLPNVGPTPVPGQMRRDLERKTDEQLLQRQRTDQVRQRNLKFEAVFNNLIERGADVNSASEFARQLVMDEESRGFRADEANKQREGAIRQSGIAEEYANKGLAAEQDYANSGNAVQQAMLRSLLGLGGSLVAGSLLSRKTQPTFNVNASPQTANAYSSQLDPNRVGLMRETLPGWTGG